MANVYVGCIEMTILYVIPNTHTHTHCMALSPVPHLIMLLHIDVKLILLLHSQAKHIAKKGVTFMLLNAIHNISCMQYTRRPQNLISADVSKNVLSMHNAARVTVD